MIIPFFFAIIPSFLFSFFFSPLITRELIRSRKITRVVINADAQINTRARLRKLIKRFAKFGKFVLAGRSALPCLASCGGSQGARENQTTWQFLCGARATMTNVKEKVNKLDVKRCEPQTVPTTCTHPTTANTTNDVIPKSFVKFLSFFGCSICLWSINSLRF